MGRDRCQQDPAPILARTGATLLLLVSAATVAGCTTPGSPLASRSRPRAVARAVVTRVLPAADQYAQLATAGNRLVLRAPGGGPGCRVVTTTVDPVGLELGQSTSASCGRPLFDGQRAAPDLAYDPRDSTESLSVAVATPQGGFTSGPVLATFEAPAGDHPVTVAADGTFWVWATPVSGGDSQVTEVSATTGEVEETVTLPDMHFGTPLVAADDDGLWVALPPTTGPNASPTPVYFVASRSGTVRVSEIAARAAWWMVAQGHQMWLDALPVTGSEEMWTAKGPDAPLRWLGPVTLPSGTQQTDDAAVGGAGGLWTLDATTGSEPSDCGSRETVAVVLVTPGRATIPVASIGVPVTACRTPLPDPDALVYRRGYLYFLVGSPLVLYRVRG